MKKMSYFLKNTEFYLEKLLVYSINNFFLEGFSKAYSQIIEKKTVKRDLTVVIVNQHKYDSSRK